MTENARGLKVTREDVLSEIRNRDRGEHPVITAEAIVEALPVEVSKRTVTSRLNELEAADRVRVIEAGRGRVYLLPGEKVEPPAKTDGSGNSLAYDHFGIEYPTPMERAAIQKLDNWFSWFVLAAIVLTASGVPGVIFDTWLGILPRAWWSIPAGAALLGVFTFGVGWIAAYLFVWTGAARAWDRRGSSSTPATASE